MTTTQLIRRLNRLPAGEYFVDIDNLFIMTSKAQNEVHVNPITGDKIPVMTKLINFSMAFNEAKYGLEYMTNGKMRFIGTNDLSTLIISK